MKVSLHANLPSYNKARFPLLGRAKAYSGLHSVRIGILSLCSSAVVKWILNRSGSAHIPFKTLFVAVSRDYYFLKMVVT